jgi:hypothetical protein
VRRPHADDLTSAEVYVWARAVVDHQAAGCDLAEAMEYADAHLGTAGGRLEVIEFEARRAVAETRRALLASRVGRAYLRIIGR